MESQDEDAKLVTRAQRGDKSAFEALYKKYHLRLQRAISQIIYNRADAEDTLQETFIKAYCALPLFRGEAAFYTWIYRIAINCAKSSEPIRKRQILQFSDPEKYAEKIANLPESSMELGCPARLLQCKETIRIIDEQISAMPPEFSRTLLFREVHGLSYEEISDAMNCSIGTVRSRLSRARQLVSAVVD